MIQANLNALFFYSASRKFSGPARKIHKLWEGKKLCVKRANACTHSRTRKAKKRIKILRKKGGRQKLAKQFKQYQKWTREHKRKVFIVLKERSAEILSTDIKKIFLWFLWCETLCWKTPSIHLFIYHNITPNLARL